MAVSAPVVLSAAEACAASLCWLSRFRFGSAVAGTTGGDRIAQKVDGYWHRGKCRWCAKPLPELMALITTTLADPSFAASEAAFKRLDGRARAARVREAQESPWYDEVTR